MEGGLGEEAAPGGAVLLKILLLGNTPVAFLVLHFSLLIEISRSKYFQNIKNTLSCGSEGPKLANAFSQGRRCQLIRLYDIPLRLYEITE